MGMRRLMLLALAFSASLIAAGNVQQTTTQLGSTNTWVTAFSWTGDASTGSVPTTAAVLGACNCQGYLFTQVVIKPGSPQPTSGYNVAILDTSGYDILGGAATGLSSTTTQSFAASTAAAPLQGTFSLSITGQSVASATGTVLVYFSKPGTVNLATIGHGGSSSSANWLTIANPPFVDARRFNFSPVSPGGSLSIGSNTVNVTVNPPLTNSAAGILAGTNLYVSGGTGTAEAVQVTGVTANTITFTAANTHSGNWNIKSICSGCQEAINSLTAPNGGIVLLPPGRINVYGEIDMGNGTSAAASGIQSIQLIGSGRGGQGGISTASAVSTLLFWQGAAGSTMINVRGPIGGVRISNMALDGNGQASHAIVNNHGFDSVFSDLNIESFNDYAIQVLSYFPSPVAIGANSNDFSNIEIIGVVSGSSGIQFGNLVATSGVGVSKNEVHNVNIAVQNIGILGGYADNIRFFGGDISAGVTGIKINSTAPGFPGRWYGWGTYVAAPMPVDDTGWNTAWGSGMGFFPLNDDGQMIEPLGSNCWAYGWEVATGQPFGCWGGTPQAYQTIASGTAISNTVTQTNFDQKYTIPIPILERPGLRVHVKAFGHYSNTGTPTLSLGVRLAGLQCASQAFTAPNNASNQPWQVDAECIIRAIGASGTMLAGGPSYFSVGFQDGLLPGLIQSPLTQTINTTVPQAVQIFAQWGTASSSNTITMDSLSVEMMTPGVVQ